MSERADQLVGHPFGEVLLRGVSGHICQREHRNRSNGGGGHGRSSSIRSRRPPPRGHRKGNNGGGGKEGRAPAVPHLRNACRWFGWRAFVHRAREVRLERARTRV